MQTGQVQSNVAPNQVAVAPTGVPAQTTSGAVSGGSGELPKKKSGFWKWFLIIFLTLAVIGLLTYVFTAIF